MIKNGIWSSDKRHFMCVILFFCRYHSFCCYHSFVVIIESGIHRKGFRLAFPKETDGKTHEVYRIILSVSCAISREREPLIPKRV